MYVNYISVKLLKIFKINPTDFRICNKYMSGTRLCSAKIKGEMPFIPTAGSLLWP